MLYEEGPPSVGVGLMYKPHYVSMESFCTTYMHLNVWHAAASSEDAIDKLDSACFILVSISEMSEVVPVAKLHPVFLDVAGKEVMERTGEPLAPLWFWGFRLHTVWSRLPGGEPVHQIAFPRLRGDATTPMLEYEPEKFPQSMQQGTKIVVSLRPPSKEHWNIDSNLILTLMMNTYQRWLEAKRAGQDPERGSAGLSHLLERRLFLRELPWPLPVAARLHPQWRPHTREKRIWRPHWVPSSAFMPSASR